MVRLPDGRDAHWLTESDAPAPVALVHADDVWSAKRALSALREGHLLWQGDWNNGRQLLSAVRRRLQPRRAPRGSLAERWRAGRAQQSREAEVLGRLLVVLEPGGEVKLRRAPDTRTAVVRAWGPADVPRLVSLRTLVGAMGASGWVDRGVPVSGLPLPLTPCFGVFSPTRQAYLSLLDDADFTGCTVLDVGCGSGVLGLLALAKGATHVTATDLDARATACASHNAARMGFAERFTAVQADLWVERTFDRVLFNPPWLPWQPRTRLDRAVFDPGGRVLQQWLTHLVSHLRPGGEGWLLRSDLPELLGLVAPNALERRLEALGLQVLERRSVAASHGRAKDAADPLHQARAREQVVLWRLTG